MFDCKLYLKHCKGACCGVFPISKEIVERNRDKIVGDVKEEIPVSMKKNGEPKDYLILNTANMRCAFQREDYLCNIYEDRDHVCRLFGNDNATFCRCPHQYQDGTPK